MHQDQRVDRYELPVHGIGLGKNKHLARSGEVFQCDEGHGFAVSIHDRLDLGHDSADHYVILPTVDLVQAPHFRCRKSAQVFFVCLQGMARYVKPEQFLLHAQFLAGRPGGDEVHHGLVYFQARARSVPVESK